MRLVGPMEVLFILLGSSSSSVFPAVFMGFSILGEIFVYVTGFQTNHRGSHIPSLWMVHAGCVFVANIHPARI